MWNRYTISRLLIICLSLFALMPCVLKQHWATDLNTTYVKGNSKSLSTCLFTAENRSAEQNVQNEQSKLTPLNRYLANPNQQVLIQDSSISSLEIVSSFSNGPPLYILHQSIRIAC